jgi:transglutaminase-like putative cysteine protease
VAAALVAFWPRPHALGLRYVALVLLMSLYAVPAVALDLGSEFLSGALLAVLVVGYLRLETLQVGDAGAAAMLATTVVILGLAAAPALDTDEPWFDYETWALSNAASRSTGFTWEHTYGALDWPRDGRELLRVKARLPAYWKATNLDDFDGHRWRRDEGSTNLDGCEFGPVQLEPERRRWLQEISVSVRNLRSGTFVTAGIACAVDAPRLSRLPLGDGTYATVTRALRRGDAYTALVYTPQPSERDRRLAGDVHPQFMGRYTRISLPGKLDPLTGAERNGHIIDFPLYEFGGEPYARPAGRRLAEAFPAGELVRESGYARTYALAQRIKRQSRSQEDFVARVMRHLRDGYAYSESPPAAAETLDGFLFDARIGYCQQFSGAMALLLRMGGVPARVSTGFTTGSFDREAGEYVVRDLDAHSWVEVNYPGIGWVTFDPTPAASPARSQPAENSPGRSTGAAPLAPDLGGDIRSDPSRQVAIAEEGPPWTLIGFLAALAVAVAALAAWLLRRRRRLLAAGWGPVQELERALRRARRPAPPGATLNALERSFGASPAAAGYVRALREQRYCPRAAPPSPSGRRAVRAELGRGGGLRGRLRAWWAMPPRPL